MAGRGTPWIEAEDADAIAGEHRGDEHLLRAEPFGAARIAMKLVPWGDATLFVLDWHALRGPGIRMHGLPVDYLVEVRNGMMPTRLARIAVRNTTARFSGAEGGPARSAPIDTPLRPFEDGPR